MANCTEYQELDSKEKFQLIGKAVHLIQNDPDVFKAISSMVRTAEIAGCFDDVRILPEQQTNNQY